MSFTIIVHKVRGFYGEREGKSSLPRACFLAYGLFVKKLYFFLFAFVLASPALLVFFPQANRHEIIREIGPLLGLGVLVLCFFAAFLCKHWKENRLSIQGKRSVLLPFALFVLWSLLSFFFAEVSVFGFAEIFMLLIGGLLLLILPQESYFPRALPWVFSGIILLATGIGIYGFLTTEHLRFFGFFYDPSIAADAWPNAYASFFLLTFPFLIYAFYGALFSSSSSLWGGLWRAVLTALSCAGFFLSLSRGAFLAAMVASFLLVLMLLIQGKGGIFLRFRFWMHLVGVLLLTMLFVNGILTLKMGQNGMDLGSRLTFTEPEGGNSASERLQFFKGALHLIQDQPFLGTGPSSFRAVYPRVQQGFLALSDHPHNLLLKWGVERGLPAVLFFLVFLLSLFWYTHPFRSQSSPLSTVAWVGLLGFMAHHMIDYNLNFVTNALALIFVFACLIAQIPLKSSRLALAMSAALAVLLALSGLRLAADELMFNRLSSLDEEGLLPLIQDFSPLLPAWEWYEKVGSSEGWVKEAWILKQLEANPLDAQAWSWLGTWQEEQGALEEARESYEMALSVNPKNTFLYRLQYARVLELLGDEAALEALYLEMEPLIEEYAALFKINLHYTQSSAERTYLEELGVWREAF